MSIPHDQIINVIVFKDIFGKEAHEWVKREQSFYSQVPISESNWILPKKMYEERLFSDNAGQKVIQSRVSHSFSMFRCLIFKDTETHLRIAKISLSPSVLIVDYCPEIRGRALQMQTCHVNH